MSLPLDGNDLFGSKSVGAQPGDCEFAWLRRNARERPTGIYPSDVCAASLYEWLYSLSIIRRGLASKSKRLSTGKRL
jgi:hypothetical protein